MKELRILDPQLMCSCFVVMFLCVGECMRLVDDKVETR